MKNSNNINEQSLIICPYCNSVLDENFENCPICGEEFESDVKIDISSHPWVLIYTTNTLIDAEMYRANLEGAGIPVNILSQIDSTRMLTVGELAIVKIYVKSPFVNQANMIIDAINSNTERDSYS